ncbi:MAG TPA: alpha/beta hydrolase [Streptosporangiaceae bacterium]|jgi:pimeloyl-ACP methyl ester carboxylesterase|nr:alpha/beta hydrolase [Streptosporangiaceae bacterium]
MANWRRVTGITGIAVGAAAAGVGAVVAAERLAANRLRLSPDPAAGEPLGELRGREFVVLAPDGVPLHVEVNGSDDAPVTIVFCHGYALHQDCWHYQRRDLAAAARLVFWDQRGHGRSGRAAAGPPVSVNQTGDDLHAVLQAVAPGNTRVILAGHSMGGMTIMALAGGHPGLFGSKIVGAVLIATTASGLSSPDGLVPWLPGPARMFLQRIAPALLRGASVGRAAALVESGRLMSRELELMATRFLAFGDPQASLTQTEFLERMIRDAPVGVISEFYTALLGCDQREVLDVLGRIPVTVVAADRDRLIPPKLSVELAETIPGARLAMVPGAGHAVMMERPDVVNDVILGMLSEAARRRPPRRLGRRRREKGEQGVA